MASTNLRILNLLSVYLSKRDVQMKHYKYYVWRIWICNHELKYREVTASLGAQNNSNTAYYPKISPISLKISYFNIIQLHLQPTGNFQILLELSLDTNNYAGRTFWIFIQHENIVKRSRDCSSPRHFWCWNCTSFSRSKIKTNCRIALFFLQ